jgi:hypothetical protein
MDAEAKRDARSAIVIAALHLENGIMADSISLEEMTKEAAAINEAMTVLWAQRIEDGLIKVEKLMGVPHG